MTDQIVVTLEAAQDFRALISGMSDNQVKQFLENTIKANNAIRFSLTKEVQKVEGALLEEFTLYFQKAATHTS